MNLLKENKMDNIIQKELLGRIKANELCDEKIVFTNINTVVFKKPGGSYYGERTYSDFVRSLREEINDNLGSVRYDKKTNKFYYIQKNKCAYEFNVPEDVMVEYASGKCNETTFILNHLYEENMKAEKKRELERKKRIDRKEIIAKAESTNETLTLEETNIYLEYLEEIKRSYSVEIAVETISTIALAVTPITLGIIMSKVGGSIVATDSSEWVFGLSSYLVSRLGIDLYFVNRYFPDDGSLDIMIPFPPYAATVNHYCVKAQEIKKINDKNKPIKVKVKSLKENKKKLR